MDINFEKTIMNRRSRTLTQMAQSTRRLNSGYRINSAADDAAGLAVSEKMRSIDVGLRQGLRNISDGMNFLATQDNAEQVINDSLHRLKEIAVEAANGTNARIDREGLDLEYQQILDEIGDITSTGDFNGVPLFDQHQPEYSKFAGEIKHTEFIDVATGKNSPLVVNYTQNGVNKTVSLKIPSGRYSADEIADIIDDELYATNSPLIIGVNSDGQFSLQCEGGKVNYITGPGRSLFYEEKEGSAGGYLIGVTQFPYPNVPLEVQENHNNIFQFRIEGYENDKLFEINLLKNSDPNDNIESYEEYTYSQLIDRMNECFKDAGLEGVVKAVPETNSKGVPVIGLSSIKPVTGLAGNFIVLEAENDFSSPLYDISTYSDVKNTGALIDGKKKLNGDITILRDRNDWFEVDMSYYVGEGKVETKENFRFELLDDGVNEVKMTGQQIVDKINSILAEEFKNMDSVPFEAILEKDGTLNIKSTQYGDGCKLELKGNAVPSGYMLTDLFDEGTLSKTPSHIKNSYYTPASFRGTANISSVEIDDSHNKLQYRVTIAHPTETDSQGHALTKTFMLDFKLDAGTYSGANIVSKMKDQLKDQMDTVVKPQLDAMGWGGLHTELEFDNTGNTLALKVNVNDESGSDVSQIEVTFDQSVSTAYRKLIRDVDYTGSSSVSDGGGSKPLKTEVSSNRESINNGTDAGKDYYTDGDNSKTSSKDGVLFNFDPCDTSSTEGAWKPRPDSDVILPREPISATLTLKNAMSQFIPGNGGKTIRESTINLTISTPNGDVTIDPFTVEKGWTFNDFMKEFNEKYKDQVQVSKGSNNDIVFTSAAGGTNVKFSSYGGSFFAEANRNPISGSYNPEYDKNSYYTCPTLTLGDAGTNLKNVDPAKGNNKAYFNVDGISCEVVLEKNMSNYDLANAIRTQINEQLKSSNKSVSVTTSGNGIKITGGENVKGDITFNSSSSTCPLDKEFHEATTVARPGSLELTKAGTNLPLTIIPGQNDTLTFSYTNASGTSIPVKITLPGSNGNTAYSKNGLGSLANDLQRAFDEQYPDHAGELSFIGTGDKLTIATKDVGSKCTFTSCGGSLGNELKKEVVVANDPGGVADPSSNKLNLPATVTNSHYYEFFRDPGLEIVKGENDLVHIEFTDNKGKNHAWDIKLDEGIYMFDPRLPAESYPPQTPKPGAYKSPDSIVTQLNNALNSSNEMLGNFIKVSGNAYGSLSLSTKGNEGVGDNVSLKADGILFKDPDPDSYRLRNLRDYDQCWLVGDVNVEGIKISSWDNKMKFTYKSNGSAEHEVEIEVLPTQEMIDKYNADNPEAKYDPNNFSFNFTAKQLQEALQTAIDNRLGPDQLTARLSNPPSNRITLISSTITNDRSMWDFEGHLYDKVFQAANFKVDPEHKEKNGTSTNIQISYILGRNPMEPATDEEIEANANVIIYPNLNDEFTFDFKYNEYVTDADGNVVLDAKGNPTPIPRTLEIKLKLPEGEYDRKKMAETIQELARQQIPFKEGVLNPEYFRATIGVGALGLPEADNLEMSSQNRLVLSYTTPNDGSIDYDRVNIEGIRGNLAYRVFYQATKVPCPTTIVGSANIKDGVHIQPGVNDKFTVGFNGELITVDLPTGKFTGEEIMNILNSIYESMGAGIGASMKGDHLMLYSTENGAFDIDPIMGSASYTLFYGGEKRNDDDDYIGIHSGRRTDSYIWYQKTRLDQHLMRINTTGVTTIERALKAMSRLDNANAYLLKWRGLNGANENRSARTYDRNNVIIENLENSESAIRDTDVPMELSKLQRQQVIQQFQDSMMKQTKQTVTDMVLNQLNQKG